jgi:hypothetical protein
LKERLSIEKTLRRLKAGHDIEDIMVQNYLKEENKI